MKITMSKVNGVGAVKKVDKSGDEYYTVPRFVIERNVLDMLEDNDDYLNLSFCDAEIITEEATTKELLDIYSGKMGIVEFESVVARILG